VKRVLALKEGFRRIEHHMIVEKPSTDLGGNDSADGAYRSPANR